MYALNQHVHHVIEFLMCFLGLTIRLLFDELDDDMEECLENTFVSMKLVHSSHVRVYNDPEDPKDRVAVNLFIVHRFVYLSFVILNFY
jgi:hypothetical protein